MESSKSELYKRIKDLETELLKIKSDQQEKKDEVYKNLFTQSHSIKLIIDYETGNIVDANESACKFYGYTYDELTNLNITQINILPDDYVRKEMRNVKHGILNHFEFKHKLKNKNIVDVSVQSSVLKINDKTYLYSIIADSSEKVKTEKDLILAKESAEEGERQFRLLFENMGQGFALHKMIYDENHQPIDYKFILANETFEMLTGLKAENIIGKTVLEVIPKLEKSWINKYAKVAQKGINISFENYSQPLKKHYKVIAYSPQPDFFATIFTDITENKLFEKELEKAKNEAEQNLRMLRTVIDTIPDLVWLKDINGIYLHCNKKFEQFFNEKEENIIGKSDFDFMDRELAEFFRNKDKIAVSNGRPTINEEEVTYTSDGHKEILETIKTPIYNNDKSVLGVLGVGRDITQRKKADKEIMLAKEKAEESDRLKSAFLANMSHEIRTPMNGILGFTELLQRPNLTGEEQQKYIEIIKKSGARMLDTVNAIIEVSKIETGQVSLIENNVNIYELINYNYNFFKPEAEKKGLSLKLVNKISNNDCNILVDESKLSSILSNLLKNAIKYTLEGEISLICERFKNHLKFTVKDSGIGIDSKRHDAVFDRFVQADIEDRQVYEGSGLGLTISKTYVEMMGGKIWLESEPGLGSTFYFTIDFKRDTQSENITKISEKVNSKITKKELEILVAEDDDISYYLLEEILSDDNYKLIRTEDGKETVNYIKQHPETDIILLDLKLPLLDGIEATKEIRKFNSSIPIIAQTAYAMSGDMDVALEAGCDEYFTKPIDAIKLREIINNYSIK